MEFYRKLANALGITPIDLFLKFLCIFALLFTGIFYMFSIGGAIDLADTFTDKQKIEVYGAISVGFIGMYAAFWLAAKFHNTKIAQVTKLVWLSMVASLINPLYFLNKIFMHQSTPEGQYIVLLLVSTPILIDIILLTIMRKRS
jgi:hypothetical protein